MKRSILLIGILFASAVASSQALPELISSELPRYPSDARAARIQGTAKLWFHVNAKGRVVKAEATLGHPLLRQAAIRNVKTWKLAMPPDVRSGKYETEFLYRLGENSSENPRVTVSMSDFRRVEITSELQTFTYTDRYEGHLDLSEPLKVYLARCELDGEVIPCEQVSVELLYKNKAVTPKRFRLGELQGFFVPNTFRKLRKDGAFGVAVMTPKGKLILHEVHPAFLRGTWEIVLAHEPFPKEWRYLFDSRKLCMGLLLIPWTEPGRIFYGSCSDQ